LVHPRVLAPLRDRHLFSALTTGSSFASLAVSGHLGTASMGIVLLTGMAMTLLSIFILMPALLGPPPASR
jgi:hypothetical protein